MPLATLGLSLVLLLAAIGSAFGQDKHGPPASPVLHVCNDKNPPPCADKPPIAVHQPLPKYSKEAKKAKIEGATLLGAVIGTDGRAHDIHVIHGLGYGLDEKAIAALEKWEFQPAKSDGKQVSAVINVEVNFRLYQSPGRKEQPTPSPSPASAAQGGVEILSDTLGFDFGPYLSQNVLPHIRQNWYNLVPEIARPPIMKKGRLAIEFSIVKDGSVAGMRLVASANDVALDRAAWGGITASNPFPPLPDEFKGQFIALRFYFYYNPNATDMSVMPLDRAANDVLRKSHENLGHDQNAMVDLTNDVQTLSSLLDKGHLDAKSKVSAHLYRGRALHLLNWLRDRQGQPIDEQMAKQALADFEFVIASNTEVAGWKHTIPETQYTAGLVARNQLRSDSMANSYWSKCADAGQGGCLYYLGSAYIAGTSGMPPDFEKALDLTHKAFDTGVDYGCIGPYAAQRIARILYFSDIRHTSDDDPLAWVQKSYVLYDQIGAGGKVKNACNVADARIDEFLYRLRAGERRDELLHQAAAQVTDDSPATLDVVRYMLGQLDEKGFEGEIESIRFESVRCYAYFEATWYARVTKNQTAAQHFADRLSEEGAFWCQPELAFAKMHRD